MRLTAVVNSLHIGNTFKQIWKVQHKRKVLAFGVKEQLESSGRQVVDPIEFLKLNNTTPSAASTLPDSQETLIHPALIPKQPQLDSSHPNWHEQPCRVHHDHSTLLTGIDEGLNIVKTCLVSNSLPDRIQSLKCKLGDEVHSKTLQDIKNAHTLDAVQVKLARTINFVKPGWVSPRTYGIPPWRKNVQLLNNMFNTLDVTLARQNIDAPQYHFNSEFTVRAPLTLDGEPVLFESRKNHLIFGRKPLKQYVDEKIKSELVSKPLPSIYPLSRTVSIFGRNIYRMESKFPIRQGAPLDALTMAVFKINAPILRYAGTQLQAKLLLSSFGVAAAYAQRSYGKDVKELPEPLTINCVQTDGRRFIFGCLQIHSLDLDSSEAANNLFWLEEPEPLFTSCNYVEGQCVLEGYNPEVMETLMALYQSQTIA